ncbi:MAG: preprotein translocase subunit SecG [Maricaulaceae bacterium]
MANVLLVIQLIISIVLIFLILIQRSEGGALGIGGGGGGGGFMSGRSATNSISRLTGILGAAFIINCMVLSVVYSNSNQDTSLIDTTNAVDGTNINPENGEEGLTTEGETDDNTTPLASDTLDAPEAAETSETAQNSDAEAAAEETPDDE